jgi:hypothetical protein
MIHEIKAIRQAVSIRSKMTKEPETAEVMRIWAKELERIIAKLEQPKFEGVNVGKVSKI